jgi:hypothetical protein
VLVERQFATLLLLDFQRRVSERDAVVDQIFL